MGAFTQETLIAILRWLELGDVRIEKKMSKLVHQKLLMDDLRPQ